MDRFCRSLGKPVVEGLDFAPGVGIGAVLIAFAPGVGLAYICSSTCAPGVGLLIIVVLIFGVEIATKHL